MKLDHLLQPLKRIRDLLERLHDVRLGEIQAVVEHRIEKLLLALDMVIKPRLRQPCRAGNIAHGGVVVAFTVKDFGRHLEYAVPRKLAAFTVFLELCTYHLSTYRPIGRLRRMRGGSQRE